MLASNKVGHDYFVGDSYRWSGWRCPNLAADASLLNDATAVYGAYLQKDIRWIDSLLSIFRRASLVTTIFAA